MEGYTEWEYYIAKANFHIFFPDGDYNIQTLVDWYKVIPTKAEKISYYGDNIELLKGHFEKFSMFDIVKTKISNDTHSNKFLNIWCTAIYNSDMELVAFAAQEFIEGKSADKKIKYFGELNGEQPHYYIDLG